VLGTGPRVCEESEVVGEVMHGYRGWGLYGGEWFSGTTG
jgi:hypothetical protein